MADSDRHRNKLVVGIRGADGSLRDDARDSAIAAGYADLSDATLAFWRWIARRHGAQRPRRPHVSATTATCILDELERAVADLYECDEAAAKAVMNDISTYETDWWANH